MAFDQAFAKAVIICEASGEPPEAQLGVANVLCNRLADGRFGKTLAEVCLTRFQFSEFNDDKGDNANLLRMARLPDDAPEVLAASHALELALTKAEPDPTAGATHYYDTSIPPPKWTVGAEMTGQLGRLVFYRGVK